MNEVEKMLKTENWEKKRTGWGANNKARHTGCKLPSDYLTAAEKKKLNGPVVSYNLAAPMDWKTYKTMPDASRKLYLTTLIEKYQAKGAWLAEMFGITPWTTCQEINRLGIPHGGPGGRKNEAAYARWQEFLGKAEDPSVAAATAPLLGELEVQEKPETPVTPDPGIRASEDSWDMLFAMVKRLSERYGVSVEIRLGVK